MEKPEKFISLEEATRGVEGAITRLALMHLAYSKTIINELGSERGEDLIIKSILDYGRRIVKVVKEGGLDLPTYGVYSGEAYQDEDGRLTATGCNLAKIFKQFNELEIGKYYCYVDPAKAMALDVEKKLIHVTSETCGDDRCTLKFVESTKEEQEAFLADDIKKWKFVDPHLL